MTDYATRWPDTTETVPSMALFAALGSSKGPITTPELLDRARSSPHGTPAVLATLGRLPEREWTSVEDAVAAAISGFVWRSAAAPSSSTPGELTGKVPEESGTDHTPERPPSS